MSYPEGFPASSYSSSPTFFSYSSSPAIPGDASLSNSGTEGETEPAFSLVSYDHNSPHQTHATSRRDFHGPRSQLQGLSSLVTGDKYPTTPGPSIHPLAATHSAWNVISSNVGHAPPSAFFRSEYPIYHTPRASAVVTNSPSTYTVVTPAHEPEREKTRLIFPVPRISAPSHWHEQVVAPPPHPDHVAEWYRVQSEAIFVNGLGEFVPQTIYQPGYEGDKKRYVHLARLHPSIIFIAEGSLEWGIPVRDLLSRGSTHVVGGNEPAFPSSGPTICIRVQWPGYQPRHRRASTTDYTPERCKINKTKLAEIVARNIDKIMDTLGMQKMSEAGTDPRWKVGRFGIRVDDIVLVSLHHVSQGSWQPQLRLRRAIGTIVAAR